MYKLIFDVILSIVILVCSGTVYAEFTDDPYLTHEITAPPYGSIGDSITVEEYKNQLKKQQAESNSIFHIGDKFISRSGDIIKLINRIPIYAPDDSCLAMQAKGYLIYCEPEAIAWRWEIIIYHYGLEIPGVTDDNELVNLKRLRE